MFINKAILYGNLTRDPELRALPSGMNVASFSVATNHVFKSKDGKKQEQTDFHNVVVFGRQADTVSQYLKKGSGVFIEGRMQTRSWADAKSGERKYCTEIVAESLQFGPRKAGDAAGGPRETDDTGNGIWPDEGSQEAPKTGRVGRVGVEYPTEDINPDDIPF